MPRTARRRGESAATRSLETRFTTFSLKMPRLRYARRYSLSDFSSTHFVSGTYVTTIVAKSGRPVLADWYVVPTGSMKPTILEGDRVFVWKSAYQLRVPFSRIRLFSTGKPHRGDVVVVRNPDGQSVPFVKRLVGLPGDKIELRNETLLVNGKPQPISFLPAEQRDGMTILLGTETLDGKAHPVR